MQTVILTNCTYIFPQLVHFGYKMKYMLIISETVQPTSEIQQNSQGEVVKHMSYISSCSASFCHLDTNKKIQIVL